MKILFCVNEFWQLPLISKNELYYCNWGEEWFMVMAFKPPDFTRDKGADGKNYFYF